MSRSETLGATARFGIAWPWWVFRAGRIFRKLIREPLVHFVLAGFVLFLAGRFYQEQTSVYRIVETKARTAQLANAYRLQFGTLPDAATLENLVQRDLHDEILYRQGLALGLDKDDEIVRRRVVQKMQFLLQDLHPPPEPSEAQLKAYYVAHKGRYVSAARVTFSHIYFSADEGGPAAAKRRALKLLTKLAPGVTRAPDLGDPFPDLYDFSNYDSEQIFRLFGHTPLADAVFQVPVGQWSGPFRSAYGWHLLYIDARKPKTQPSFSQVRDAVRTDFLQDAQEKANRTAFADLARQFVIVRKDRERTP